MSDTEAAPAQTTGFVKRQTHKKFFYRGIEVQDLIGRPRSELLSLFPSNVRRRLKRGLKAQPLALIKRLRKAKKAAGPNEKPAPVNTHLRNMIVVPEMVGSVVGVYNGKAFGHVEVKPDMVGHYLGEFSLSYKPVQHGRPGIGATNSSRFIPLK
ncbi:40S ribosomal protein S15 [Plasmodiophora brassicae]|uniref:40S ribosomal protein S15 n=2 Tax=Plasmodiophora brassicae TaxID=37360 RepID=A0A3P3YB76_PLABS|nr:unnamed protein product [Plasmodiophora brassicae]